MFHSFHQDHIEPKKHLLQVQLTQRLTELNQIFNKIETKQAGPIENKIERPPLQKATLVDDSIGDAVSPVGDNIVG